MVISKVVLTNSATFFVQEKHNRYECLFFSPDGETIVIPAKASGVKGGEDGHLPSSIPTGTSYTERKHPWTLNGLSPCTNEVLALQSRNPVRLREQPRLEDHLGAGEQRGLPLERANTIGGGRTEC